MRRFPFARLLLLALLSSPLVHAELPETDWLELMPPADRKALEEMPDIVHDTPEAAGTFTSKGGLKQSDRKMPAVMYSAKTVASLDGKA
ncbi:DUF3299 domain-containing protein, partial [Pseudomonas aeruginosa]|nr:DUF3299 domain-containing protein [Pseudomonas aeruginosa]